MLATLREVLSIIRDLLLIGFLAAALLGVVSIPNLTKSLAPLETGSGAAEKQPIPPAAGALTDEAYREQLGSGYAGEKISDPALKAIYDEAENAFNAGNTEQGLSALARLEEAFQGKDMANEVNIVRNLRQAAAEQDEANVRRYGFVLQDMFGS